MVGQLSEDSSSAGAGEVGAGDGDSAGDTAAAVSEGGGVEDKEAARARGSVDMLMRRALGLGDDDKVNVRHITSSRAACVAAVASHVDTVVLSFRGTKDVIDVLTDLDGFPTPFAVRPARPHPPDERGARDETRVQKREKRRQRDKARAKDPTAKPQVHRGFLTAWDSVADEVAAVLDASQARKVLFVGHSMGGGLAQLAAAYFSQTLPPDCEATLVTVAAPAVGNSAFRDLLCARVAPNGGLRIVGVGDVVPFLGASVGYLHAGAEVRLELPASAVEQFRETNGAALVPGFAAIAPHVLFAVGRAVFAFWMFRGPAAPSALAAALTPAPVNATDAAQLAAIPPPLGATVW